MAAVSDPFQQALFALVQRLMPVDGMRFYLYVPWAQLQQEATSTEALDPMMRSYAQTFWEVDPMHPSRFEEREVVVVSNSMLMHEAAWRSSAIYTGFYAPNGYAHNCDMFLKQQGRIVAVLSLVRRNPAQPFTDDEVARLNQVQPFVEYSLGALHVSNRAHSRSSLAQLYRLTARELDVVEIALTGASNKVVCRHLDISLPTLRTHMQHIYTKVGVRSSAELVARLGRVASA